MYLLWSQQIPTGGKREGDAREAAKVSTPKKKKKKIKLNDLRADKYLL